MKPEDARARLDAGAVLVQVYTGLVYAGPGLIKRIVQIL
jgi:dihydroorotate dehydrogenase